MAPVKEVKKPGSTVAVRKPSSGKVVKKNAGKINQSDAKKPGVGVLNRNEAAFMFANEALNKKNSMMQAVRQSTKGISHNKGQLAVPPGSPGGRGSPKHNLLTVGAPGLGSRMSVASGASANSSAQGSSAGSQDSDDFRKNKRKGKSKHKKDNILTRFRDTIAETDVLIERTSVHPHVTCIHISCIAMPIFLILLIWDTLALTIFEIPRLSLIDHPVFILVFQCVCILIAMYGYCVQVVEDDKSRIVTFAIISIGCHIALFIWRVLLEIMADGYRYQEKSFLPKSKYELFDDSK